MNIIQEIAETKIKTLELENQLKFYSRINGAYLGKATLGNNKEICFIFEADQTVQCISTKSLKDIVKFLNKLNRKGK